MTNFKQSENSHGARKLFILLFSVFLFTALFSNLALAQTATSPSQGTVVATVNVSNAKIVSNEGRNYKLSFDISNRIGAQPQIKYSVRLTKDNLIVDEKVYDESLSLGENMSITKAVDYSIPASIPTGSYKLWLDSKNNNGLPLGVAYFGEIKIVENISDTILLVPDSCNFVDETYTKLYPLDSGPIIESTDTLSVECKVESSFSNNILLFPEFITRSNSLFGDIVATTGGAIVTTKGDSKEGILINKGNNILAVTLPKASKSGSYHLSFSLVSSDKKTTSNIIPIDYVVAGITGTIQNVVFDKTYYKVGETANLQIYSTQSEAGSITATILDEKGDCSASSTKQVPTFSIINLSVPITKDCTNPKANIVLSSNGNVLDSQNIQVETVLSTTTSTTASTSKIIFIAIFVAFILFFIYRFFLRK
jgi:hypothetical protein